MRKNFPIYDVETVLRDDQYLISKTDLKGRITYANPAFIDVSGYTREELIGKPHNLIRHPHMPPAAFQDLWDTLHAGKPWLGLVKNRRKDGGFYWVLANVVPIVKDDEITGYASVRVKATPEQIAEAEAFYQRINDGQAKGYAVQAGQAVRVGWRRMIDWAAMPFRRTLRAGMFRLAAFSTATVSVASLYAYTGGLPPESAEWMLAGLGLATVANVAYGWVLMHRVLRPLDGVGKIARQVASGNLTLDIDTDQPGEFGRLYFYLDMMRKSLLAIAADVHAGVQGTTSTAATLHASNAHLATRTDGQAASLQSTAASMEEITITVKQNADNAAMANRLANETMHIAERGGSVVSQVVYTMQGIHESSRRIGDIVSLIEEIAFQTNILALNAAVESARAGAAGRGFAVVAAEVRSLAQKSAAAANDIKALIETSVEQMAAGSEQAENAGRSMQEVLDAVRKVTDIMAEMSTASAEQSIGLQQINTAISQMDGATHENAALVQELGHTVQALSGQAESLRLAIDVLDTGDASEAARANPPPVLEMDTGHRLAPEPRALPQPIT